MPSVQKYVNLVLAQLTEFSGINLIITPSIHEPKPPSLALVGQGLEGGPDPAFPPLFRKNLASYTFFISFPNPSLLSQKNMSKCLISAKATKCKM